MAQNYTKHSSINNPLECEVKCESNIELPLDKSLVKRNFTTSDNKIQPLPIDVQINLPMENPN